MSSAENPKPALAVLYAAKSTADLKGSIPTQLEDGRALAEREGLSVIAEFKDEAKSAFHGDRGDGLAAALAKCEELVAEGRSVSLVVQHSDRLARGDARQAKHLVEYVLWSIKAGVRIRSVQDPDMFPEGDYGLLMSAIGGMRNNEDSKRKSAAVRDGLTRRARDRGKLSGGPRPFGYRWVKTLLENGDTEGHLEVVPAEAKIVLKVFEDSAAGKSQRQVAVELAAAGVPTVMGGQWRQASVRNMLTNVVYVGQVFHNGTAYPGAHDAIVSQELFDRATVARERKVRTSGHGGGRMPRGPHLFTRGLLRCGKCGEAMIPRHVDGRPGKDGTIGKPYDIYLCGSRVLGRECAQNAVPQALVDEAMLNQLERSYLDIEGMRQRLADQANTDKALAADALANAEAEGLKAGERLTRVQRAFQDGHLDPSDYAEQRRQLLSEQEAAGAALERARRHTATLAEQDALEVDDLLFAKLAELRESILSSTIGDAQDLNSLRRLLHQLFAEVKCGTSPSGRLILTQSLRWETLSFDRAFMEWVAAGEDPSAVPDGPGVRVVKRALELQNSCTFASQDGRPR